MSAEATIIRRALALLHKRNLVLSIHDPSFPGAPGEDIGRGSPYTRGGRGFIEFIAGLGFTGLQFGPQGQTSPDNKSPYDGTIFARNLLSVDLLALAHDPRWAELPYWWAIAKNSSRWTPDYLLASVDLKRNAQGDVVRVGAEEAAFSDILLRTFSISAVVTLMCILLGYPLAYWLATLSDRKANLMMILVLLPFWTSVLVRIAAWIVLLQTNGLVNRFLMFTGLTGEPVPLLFNRLGVIIAMVHILLPFMILPLYSVMKSVPGNYVRAAVSLGSPPLAAFFRVYVPQTYPGIGAGALLGFDDEKAKVFDIAIQTGAIFAVILVYWQKIRSTLIALPNEKQAQQFALNVLIAFIPAVVLGLLFGKAIKANLFTPVVVASTFIIGGFIILWAERRHKNNPGATRVHDVDTMTSMDAVKVGLVQCLAMIPGTSRSGATIIGGMLLGLSRKAATDFSFFLAMPTLIGAGAYSLLKERALLSSSDIPMFAVGLVFAFFSAWLCIRWLLRYISSHSFVPFAWYRIVFGVVVLATASGGWVKWAA